MPRLTVDALIDLAGGVSQLGERLGVARTTVIGWRTAGNIPGNRVAQISMALGVPALDLLPLVQPPRSSGNVQPTPPVECAA